MATYYRIEAIDAKTLEVVYNGIAETLETARELFFAVKKDHEDVFVSKCEDVELFSAEELELVESSNRYYDGMFWND